jgi:DNA-binding MarR family transcriptional regulator
MQGIFKMTGTRKAARDLRPLGDPGSKNFTLDYYPFYLLNRAVARYNVVIDAELRQIGIDIPTWRVLMILGEKSPQPIGQIAKLAVINISTMMRIVEKMLKADLIRSIPSESDGRITELKLSATGRSKLTAARSVTSPVYKKLIRGIGSEDFSEMLRLLNLLHANLE